VDFDSPWDPGSAFGDRYVSMTRTEAECEQLGRDFAHQAELAHPLVISRLRRALQLVLSDLGIDHSSGVVEALWMPYEMQNEIEPSSPHNHTPDVPGDWWRGAHLRERTATPEA